MKRKIKENIGITLIALVITIIVMMILAGVTISMAVNGGLFGYAGDAASKTKTARDEEKDLANVEGGLSTEQLIAKYTGANPDLEKLREYFVGKYKDEVMENDLFVNNDIIPNASESIKTSMGKFYIIEYKNNRYQLTFERYYPNGNPVPERNSSVGW